MCVCVEVYSDDIAISDVKSRMIAHINTCDPSIIIELTLEVLCDYIVHIVII